MRTPSRVNGQPTESPDFYKTSIVHPRLYHKVQKGDHCLSFSFFFFLSVCRNCLLECNVREVRVVVASILEKTLESALCFKDAGLDCLLDMLLSLLDKDVPENCKNCSQYFSLFSNFAQRVRKQETNEKV